MSHYRRFFEQLHASPRIAAGTLIEEYAWASLAIPDGVHSVLDVGCGRGEFVMQLGPRYWAVGADFVRPRPEGAGGRFIQASADALPFPDHAFDLVTCFEVLEQLPRESFARALGELQRVTRRHLVVSVPNQEVLDEGLAVCAQCSCAFHPSWHVRSFNCGVLRGLFPDFEMEACSPVGPRVRYGGTRLSRLAVLSARRTPPAVAVCPQCGQGGEAGRAALNPAALSRGYHRRLRRLAWVLLFRQVRAYWLLAVYARRGTGSSMGPEH